MIGYGTHVTFAHTAIKTKETLCPTCGPMLMETNAMAVYIVAKDFNSALSTDDTKKVAVSCCPHSFRLSSFLRNNLDCYVVFVKPSRLLSFLTGKLLFVDYCHLTKFKVVCLKLLFLCQTMTH